MPESFAHADVKNDLYWLFQSQEIFAETEKIIGKNRTDLCTEINGFPVAIEIQASYISDRTILKRMRENTDNGYYTLWILVNDKPARWKLNIQQKQGGVLFIFKKGKLWLARMDNDLTFEDGEVQATNKKYIYCDSSIDFEEIVFCDEWGLKIATCNLDWLAYLDI